MFTIKVTYRSETREFSFESSSSFPTYQQVAFLPVYSFQSFVYRTLTLSSSRIITIFLVYFLLSLLLILRLAFSWAWRLIKSKITMNSSLP